MVQIEGEELGSYLEQEQHAAAPPAAITPPRESVTVDAVIKTVASYYGRALPQGRGARD
jgi:hypothetical protein